MHNFGRPFGDPFFPWRSVSHIFFPAPLSLYRPTKINTRTRNHANSGPTLFGNKKKVGPILNGFVRHSLLDGKGGLIAPEWLQ